MKKLNVAKTTISVLDRVENIVGKGENAGYQTKPFKNINGKRENAGDLHFLLFPQCFLPYQSIKDRNHLFNNSTFIVSKCLQFDRGQDFAV